MPDQPIELSSALAEPFKPKVFTIEVTQRAISKVCCVLSTDLSDELYSEMSSEMNLIATGVPKESQSAL